MDEQVRTVSSIQRSITVAHALYFIIKHSMTCIAAVDIRPITKGMWAK
jgi:hypothetical protein